MNQTPLRCAALRWATVSVTVWCIACGGGSPGSAGVADSARAARHPNSTDSPNSAAAAGFASPENLVYDSVADVYLVANVNGGAVARDSNGFISRVAPDGRVISLKWIDGAHPQTRLDGPKGLAIRGDTLAVADVGAVRLFNRATGASLGVWKVPGELMNDVAFAPDGALYVTDTGAQPGLPNTNDLAAVYRFGRVGHSAPLVTGVELGGPDGIVVTDTDVVYATFDSNMVVSVSRDGARHALATMPGGKVDGLRRLPDGSYVATSWNAHLVLRLLPNGTRQVELSNVTSPAGVAYDPVRKQLAVTSMQDNRFYIVPLK